jgi:hypothetical protein
MGESECSHGATPGGDTKVKVAKGKNGTIYLPPGPGHYLAYESCGHHWGTENVIDIMCRASQAWYDAAPREIVREGVIIPRFGVGDLSHKQGADIGHNTHKDGRAVDLFIFRKDRKREIFNHTDATKPDVQDPWGDVVLEKAQPSTHRLSAQYDQDLTLQFLELFIATAGAKNIFFIVFNDPVVLAALEGTGINVGDDAKLNKSVPHPVHDNHIHVHFLK